MQVILLEIAFRVVQADRPETVDRHILERQFVLADWQIGLNVVVLGILVRQAAPGRSAADQEVNRIDVGFGAKGVDIPFQDLGQIKNGFEFCVIAGLVVIRRDKCLLGARIDPNAVPGQKAVITDYSPHARDFTQAKGSRNRKLTAEERALNRTKSSVRSKVEHQFGIIKRQFGFSTVRYRGLDKNAHRLFVACALSNIVMAKKTLLSRSRLGLQASFA